MTVKKAGNPKLVKGVSGNPAGRPVGSKNALTQMQNALIEQFAGAINKDFEKIIKVVVKKALEGDLVAAKMLLDRAIPQRKAVEHYGGHEGFGGINIIIKGLNDDVPKLPHIEGEFEEVTED